MTGNEMLDSIRATLWARAEGSNIGGDIEVMKAVDAILTKTLREAAKIAGDAMYNGDYPNNSTDSQDVIARWIRDRILALIPKETT